MVENCLLNNNNILCSISSKAKFNIKKKTRQTYQLQAVRLEIFISLNVFLQFFTEEKHCKFTYNDAHNINTAQQIQQPAVYLFDFAFYMAFSARLLFWFYLRNGKIFYLPNNGFLAAVLMGILEVKMNIFVGKKYKNLWSIMVGLDSNDGFTGFSGLFGVVEAEWVEFGYTWRLSCFGSSNIFKEN